MIEFHNETNFKLKDEDIHSLWISTSIEAMDKQTGNINYIFCDDDYLLSINQDYLNHDTFTDIISFDYSEQGILAGDIFISVDRVKDNAHTFNVSFENELARILIHGVLHFAGYADKTKDQKKEMRKQEDYYLSLHPSFT